MYKKALLISYLICYISVVFSYAQKGLSIKSGSINGYNITHSHPIEINTTEEFKFTTIVVQVMTEERMGDLEFGKNYREKNIEIEISNDYANFNTYKTDGSKIQEKVLERISDVYKITNPNIFDSYVAAFWTNKERDISFIRLMEDKNLNPIYLVKYDLEIVSLWEGDSGNAMVLTMKAFSNHPLNKVTKKSLYESFANSFFKAIN